VFDIGGSALLPESLLGRIQYRITPGSRRISEVALTKEAEIILLCTIAVILLIAGY